LGPKTPRRPRGDDTIPPTTALPARILAQRPPAVTASQALRAILVSGPASTRTPGGPARRLHRTTERRPGRGPVNFWLMKWCKKDYRQRPKPPLAPDAKKKIGSPEGALSEERHYVWSWACSCRRHRSDGGSGRRGPPVHRRWHSGLRRCRGCFDRRGSNHSSCRRTRRGSRSPFWLKRVQRSRGASPREYGSTLPMCARGRVPPLAPRHRTARPAVAGVGLLAMTDGGEGGGVPSATYPNSSTLGPIPKKRPSAVTVRRAASPSP
jgi:hypothetical protein